MHKPLHDHLNLTLCYPWTSYLVLIYILMFSTFINLLSLQMWRYSNLTCCFLVCVWILVRVNVLMFVFACVCLCLRVHVILCVFR